VRFWGVKASYAFIEQPQTNGVAERFFRTLKEQIVYGRLYRTVAELRAAVETFVDLYNEHWLQRRTASLVLQRPGRRGTLSTAWRSPRKAVSCPGIRVRYTGSFVDAPSRQAEKGSAPFAAGDAHLRDALECAEQPTE